MFSNRYTIEINFYNSARNNTAGSGRENLESAKKYAARYIRRIGDDVMSIIIYRRLEDHEHPVRVTTVGDVRYQIVESYY